MDVGNTNKALVLSGGGASAAFHLGVVEELYKRGHRWDVFCGTSAGAIQAAYLSQFSNLKLEDIQELQKLWIGIRKYKPIQLRAPWFISALWRPSVLKSDNILKVIHQHICPDAIRLSGNKLCINAVDLSTGKPDVFREHSLNLRKGILASASIPGAFPPVRLWGKFLVDGAVRTNTPGIFARMMRNEVDISVCNRGLEPWDFGKRPSTIEVLRRSFDIVMDEAFSNDFVESSGVLVVRPSDKLPGLLNFSEKNAKKAIEAGRQAARGTVQQK